MQDAIVSKAGFDPVGSATSSSYAQGHSTKTWTSETSHVAGSPERWKAAATRARPWSRLTAKSATLQESDACVNLGLGHVSTEHQVHVRSTRSPRH